jgi:hypothetical protein
MQAGSAQVSVQGTHRSGPDHVAWAGRGKRRHRNPTRQGFEQDQAERVGDAGEHEYIGRRVYRREFLAVLRANEYRVRETPGERPAQPGPASRP